MKPDSICIGAQKCGTSWIHRNLAEHPSVVVATGTVGGKQYFSTGKDTQFFTNYYDRGYEWYESLFPPTTSGQKLGEVSTAYFYDSDAPSRVKQYHPDVKLFVCLRNPVERIVSNHRHEVTAGHISKKHHPFSAALNNNPAYIMQSRYTLHLKNWLEHFPSRQLKVFFFDDLRADPASFLHSLYEYLDVDPDFIPVGFSEPANVGRIPGNRGVDKSIASAGRFLRAIGLDGLIRLIRRTGIKDRVQQTNTNREISAIAEVSEQQQAELRELLREDILELSRLTERDLTGWTTPS